MFIVKKLLFSYFRFDCIDAKEYLGARTTTNGFPTYKPAFTGNQRVNLSNDDVTHARLLRMIHLYYLII